MAKGSATRDRIMDIAEEGVLSKGFDATSIDEVVAAAGITKGGFFYHFPDKNALAIALLERYIETEEALLDDLETRADQLTDDPLQKFLVCLKLLEELLTDMPNGHPGCLIASATYQERLFNADVHALNRGAILSWRKRFRAMLDAIVVKYPPRDEVDLDNVADMLSSTVDGGIVISKALSEPKAVAKQVRLYRSYIKLLFSPAP